MAINDVIQQGGQPPMQQPAQGMEQPADQGMQPMGADQGAGATQEDYERVVLAGIKTLSDQNANQGIMQMLGNENLGEPAERLARATTTIVTGLDDQSGGTIPEDVILPAAGEILENVADFANESGVMQVDEPTLGKAGQLMMLELFNQYGVDPEDMAGVMAGMDEKAISDVVSQQDAYANSGMPQQQLPPVQQPQPLPGIINETVGA